MDTNKLNIKILDECEGNKLQTEYDFESVKGGLRL
jgi:hypothetical protein